VEHRPPARYKTFLFNSDMMAYLAMMAPRSRPAATENLILTLID